MRGRLGEDVLDHPAGHVCQPEVPAGVAVGQARVIQPHQVEQRRVQVVHVHRVGGDADAVFVSLTVRQPASYPEYMDWRRGSGRFPYQCRA